jgi:hypothetical protein
MVHTRATEDATLDIPEGSVGHGCGCGQATCDNASRLPVSIEQLLATQNELMSVLI